MGSFYLQGYLDGLLGFELPDELLGGVVGLPLLDLVDDKVELGALHAALEVVEGVIAAVVGDSVLLEVVGPDLVASVDGGDLARSGAALALLLLAELLLGEPGPQDGEGLLLVLVLGALVLDADNDACREVDNAHGGLGGVDVLAAGAAGTHHVDAELVGPEGAGGGAGGAVVVHLGQDHDAGGGGVDAALGFRGGDALDAVDAGLVAEAVVGAVVVDDEGGLGDAGAGRVVGLGQHLVLPAAELAVPHVHGEQVCGKDVGLVAAGARPQLQDRSLVCEGVLRQQPGLEPGRGLHELGHRGLQLCPGLVGEPALVAAMRHVHERLVVLVQRHKLLVHRHHARHLRVPLVLVDVELAALRHLVFESRQLLLQRLCLLQQRRMQLLDRHVDHVLALVVALVVAPTPAHSTRVQPCQRPPCRCHHPCVSTCQRRPQPQPGGTAQRSSQHHRRPVLLPNCAEPFTISCAGKRLLVSLAPSEKGSARSGTQRSPHAPAR